MIKTGVNIALISFLCLLLTSDGRKIHDYFLSQSQYKMIINQKYIPCQVNKCKFCSKNDSKDCDVCQQRYVLDQFTQTICVSTQNSILICTSKTSTCSLNEINLNGTCQKCAVPSCAICSINDSNQCDVCNLGYVLDQLTLSKCVLSKNSTPICAKLECLCSNQELMIKDRCLKCTVNDCLLCSFGNQNECDVCQSGYILDDLTKSLCVLALNSVPNCTTKSCICSPYKLLINNTCLSCLAPNCLLCAVDNRYKCDICKKGYIFDYITKKICISDETFLVNIKNKTQFISQKFKIIPLQTIFIDSLCLFQRLYHFFHSKVHDNLFSIVNFLFLYRIYFKRKFKSNYSYISFLWNFLCQISMEKSFMLNYIERQNCSHINQQKQCVSYNIRNIIPTRPEGRKTVNEKNPFHMAINMRREVKPHTGHIAIRSEMTEITPATAPTGTNFGLYSSILFTLNQQGNTKLVYRIKAIRIVYPAILI